MFGSGRRKLPFSRTELLMAGPPPEGKYTWRVKSADVSMGGNGDERLEVDLVIDEGPEAGRTIRMYYGFTPNQREALAQLFDASGAIDEADEELDARVLEGKTFNAELTHEVGGDGKKWPRLYNLEHIGTKR